MKFKDLKNSLTDKAERIYLLEGADAYLRQKALELIKNAYLQQEEFNYEVFDSSIIKTAPEDFYASVTRYPFFSDKRLVVINEFYPTASEIKSKLITKILNEEIDTTILIVNNSNKCEQLKKQKGVTLVDCNKLEDEYIVKYIRSTCKKNNVVVTNDGALKLIEYCLGDMSRISMETQKIIDYVGENGTFDEDIAKEIVSKDTDYQVYELTEKLAVKNNDKALTILKEMAFNTSNNQIIFVSILNHFRRMFYSAISNATDLELAEVFSVKEFAIKKARQQAKAFKPKRLKEICDNLTKLDYDFKSGVVNINDGLIINIFKIMVGE